MADKKFVHNFIFTGEEVGTPLDELILATLDRYQVEYITTDCNTGACTHVNPNASLRQGITALAATIQAMQTVINDLTARIEALENP